MLGRIKVGVSSRFEVEGLEALKDIPILSAIPAYLDTGSTDSNQGCIEGGKQVFDPSPVTTTIQHVTVTFNSSEDVNKVQQWFNDCKGAGDRDVKKVDVNIMGYDANDKKVSTYRVKDCYPEHLDLGTYDSENKSARKFTVRLAGSSIESD